MGSLKAIGGTWPLATVQTCTVHLIRSSLRFVGYQDRKKVAAKLRLIYTAPTVEAAETALTEFAATDLGVKYPATVKTWRTAWEKFIPFLAFPPELRKIVYTTTRSNHLTINCGKSSKIVATSLTILRP